MTSFADDEAQLRNWLIYYLVTNVGCSPDQIDPDLPLNELGVGSRDAVVLAGELSELLAGAAQAYASADEAEAAALRDVDIDEA